MRRFGEDKTNNRVIKVTGEATVSAKPDIAVISFNVSELSQDYSEAVNGLDAFVNEIKTALSKLHIDVNLLKTASFNVNTEYEGYSDDKGVWKNRFTGYRATESLKLELGLDNKLLGELLTAVSAASAHPEINVRFSVKDKTKLKDRLISRAVKDSARKAKILCEAADVELGEVMTINYSFREPEIFSPTAYNRGVGLMEAKAAMCDITPEDVSLTDSVTVLWEIK